MLKRLEVYLKNYLRSDLFGCLLQLLVKIIVVRINVCADLDHFLLHLRHWDSTYCPILFFERWN